MKKIIRVVGISVFIMSMTMAAALKAQTITIGKGTGIVWEGMPFSETLSLPVNYNTLHSDGVPLVAITPNTNRCVMTDNLNTSVAGYRVYPIAEGVGLVPRATGHAVYRRNDKDYSLSGTLGLPETSGQGYLGFVVQAPSGRDWCLPAINQTISNFYDEGSTIKNLVSGTWAIVADGNQSSQEIQMPAMYSVLASVTGGATSGSILPANITLRISTLECVVNTSTTINFGTVSRNPAANSQLATQIAPLVVTCGQDSNYYINSNVAVQFRALSRVYDATPSRLALNEGGGYITGEIDNGVSGSGACNATTGVKFDNTQIKIGEISNSEGRKTFNNQIIWRLCSGGASLPTGAVTASAEMMVTFF